MDSIINIKNQIKNLDSNDKDTLKKTYIKLRKLNPDLMNNIKLFFYHYHAFEFSYYKYMIEQNKKKRN